MEIGARAAFADFGVAGLLGAAAAACASEVLSRLESDAAPAMCIESARARATLSACVFGAETWVEATFRGSGIEPRAHRAGTAKPATESQCEAATAEAPRARPSPAPSTP